MTRTRESSIRKLRTREKGKWKKGAKAVKESRRQRKGGIRKKRR
jgi:hypothetical protein